MSKENKNLRLEDEQLQKINGGESYQSGRLLFKNDCYHKAPDILYIVKSTCYVDINDSIDVDKYVKIHSECSFMKIDNMRVHHLLD